MFRAPGAAAITALDADADLLVAGDRDGCVRVWSRRTRKSAAAWPCGGAGDHQAAIIAMRLLPTDGRLFTYAAF